MPEHSSFVNFEKVASRPDGHRISVITSPGKETNPADSQLAESVVAAFALHSKEVCELAASNRCAAFIVEESFGDGKEVARAYSYSVGCSRPCPMDLPEAQAKTDQESN